MTLRVLSLFAGIGGIDLGLERAGMVTVAQCEIDPFCNAVLAKHWPDVPRYTDVRTLDGNEWRGRADLVAGGFPCQDISSANVAGRKGLEGERSGLWLEFARVIGQCLSRWVLIENSPEWRRWVPDVRRDLWRLGYSSVSILLSAGDIGAPHRRPRCWVVANSDRDGKSIRAIHAQASSMSPYSGPLRLPDTSIARAHDGLPHRLDRGRALGNAVVPQVVEVIGRWIMEQERGNAAESRQHEGTIGMASQANTQRNA